MCRLDSRSSRYTHSLPRQSNVPSQEGQVRLHIDPGSLYFASRVYGDARQWKAPFQRRQKHRSLKSLTCSHCTLSLHQSNLTRLFTRDSSHRPISHETNLTKLSLRDCFSRDYSNETTHRKIPKESSLDYSHQAIRAHSLQMSSSSCVTWAKAPCSRRPSGWPSSP